jgi:GNAT superfamily N-acetyltransferase
MTLGEHMVTAERASLETSLCVRSVRERFASLPAPPFENDLTIERGTLADHRRLAPFHYRSAHPGAVTSVFRMVHRVPSIADRFAAATCANASLETLPNRHEVVGVLVRSLPALACALRDAATNRRYADLAARDGAVMLNREVRCISRVVIDPRFRGLGLAVRLVRHALAHPEQGIIYTEALAAMGRVSPFFEKAGMTRYDRPLRCRADRARLLDAMEHVGLTAAMLASRIAVDSHFKGQIHGERMRAFLDLEFRRWRRAAHRTPKAQLDLMSFDDLRKAARDHLLSHPVHYLYHHDQPR